MIRTLCTLTPGTKQDGTRCLRGELSRTLTTTDAAGNRRQYPRGTPLVLVKNPRGGSYSLLATLPDEPEPVDFAREVAELLAADPSPF